MGLFKPAWQSKNRDMAKRAVERLTDQQTLAQVVSSVTNEDVRVAAVEKLTDQVALAKIATGDSNGRVRRCALNRIDDQTILSNIVINCHYSDVCATALHMITDQAVLADLVNRLGPSQQKVIADKSTNQDALAYIAKNNKDSDTRMIAAEKLTNENLAQEVYIDIAKNERKNDVRLNALKKIKDEILRQKMYADFAMRGVPGVIDKIVDIGILKSVWEQWKEPSKWKHNGRYGFEGFVNKLANRLIESYDDQNILLDIVQYAPGEACKNAWEKLKRLGYQVNECETHEFIGGIITDYRESNTHEQWKEHFKCRKCGETKSENGTHFFH